MGPILRCEKLIVAIPTNAKNIVFCCRTIASKDEAPCITPAYLHLHLKGKVAEVCIVRNAGKIKSLRINAGLICSTCERAASAPLCLVYVPIAARIATQRLIKRGSSLRGRAIDVL